MPPQILITGADGQLGWELTRTAQALGEVHALRRADCDLADAGSLQAALERLRPTVILNAAAYTQVDRAESEPGLAMRVNAEAVGEMGRWAADHDALVLHFSTDYVFDGEASVPYLEDSPTAPQSVYGNSKLEGERALVASGASALTCRTSWLYATRGNNFVRTMLRLARERDVLRVVADQRGSPTWARWLAEASTQLLAGASSAQDRLAALKRLGGIVHLTAAGETSWHGFAQRIVELDPARVEQTATRIEAIGTADYPTPARRPAYSVLSGAKAEALGVRRTHWEAQLEQALASAS